MESSVPYVSHWHHKKNTFKNAAEKKTPALQVGMSKRHTGTAQFQKSHFYAHTVHYMAQ